MTAGVPEISRVEMGWGEHIMQNASTGGWEAMGKGGDEEGRHPSPLGKRPEDGMRQ